MLINTANLSTLSDAELSDQLSRLWWSLNVESWGRDWKGKNECLIDYDELSREWLRRHPKPQSSAPAPESTGRKRSPLERFLEEL